MKQYNSFPLPPSVGVRGLRGPARRAASRGDFNGSRHISCYQLEGSDPDPQAAQAVAPDPQKSTRRRPRLIPSYQGGQVG